MEKSEALKQVLLERVKLTGQSIATLEALKSGVDPAQLIEGMAESMKLQVVLELLSEKLATIKYPLNWWEAFKERWFPKWLLRRFPVQYRHYEARAFYPKISLPEQKGTIIRFIPKWDSAWDSGEE